MRLHNEDAAIILLRQKSMIVAVLGLVLVNLESSDSANPRLKTVAVFYLAGSTLGVLTTAYRLLVWMILIIFGAFGDASIGTYGFPAS